MFSRDQAIEFENDANPHSWFLVACELHEQATYLYANSSSTITEMRFEGGSRKSWKTSNRSVFLLSGFALENLIKAFLVYEKPHSIGNGTLAGELRSHKLTKLAARSDLIPYRVKGMRTLEYFEDGLESWARYPCGLNYAQTKNQVILSERRWNNYLWLARSYEKRLRSLLSDGWKGPHEFEGYFTITGNNWISQTKS